MIELKDGSNTDDNRLDRLIQFDERSRNYPIRSVVKRRPRSYTWRITKDYIIDQAAEGACVGFAITNELLARPAEVRIGGFYVAQRFAREIIYWGAQKIDPWPGGSYPGAHPFYEGTSTLAGIKIAKNMGYFEEYRWAFGIEDLVYGLGHNGPSVLGITWTSSMYTPDSNGYIRPEGKVVGGHAILARGITIKWKSLVKHLFTRTFDDVDLDKSYVTLRNSWGKWGINGDCKITLRDLDTLLRDNGEAVFMVKRKSKL